ncbi:hypothetical protein ACO03_11210 [Pantoea ananatis]|nr:hypothetical protein ACO03_11210 [Pantoea ananatis]
MNHAGILFLNGAGFWVRVSGLVCLRKASDGDVISREEIKEALMLLLRAKLERNVEVEPAIIFAVEQLMDPPC